MRALRELVYTKIVAKDGSFECELGDLAGSGRQGEVYRVKASNTGLSDIVIKVMLPDKKRSSSQILHHVEQLLAPETKRAFYQTPSLECVLITPFISHDDKCCLLMPRGKGEVLETVEAWEKIKHLPLNQKLYLAFQIAQGIETIHQAERIHADIAGSNIIVDISQLRAFIIDIDAGSVVNSVPAEIVGHANYLAPELEKTQNKDDVTLETDRWSLAVLLHHVIIGCLPFQFCINFKDCFTYEQNWPPDTDSVDKETIRAWKKNRKWKGKRDWLLWQHQMLQQFGDLAVLFRRCFGPGQRNPKTRPTANEWLQRLSLELENKPSVNKLCPTCGHENQWELVYCDNCAAVLHQALIRCVKCGGYKPVNALFCPKCGARAQQPQPLP